jgi:hypothetical protein
MGEVYAPERYRERFLGAQGPFVGFGPGRILVARSKSQRT